MQNISKELGEDRGFKLNPCGSQRRRTAGRAAVRRKAARIRTSSQAPRRSGVFLSHRQHRFGAFVGKLHLKGV